MKIDSKPLPVWAYCLPPLLMVMITFLFYYPSLHYSFQFDDIANITKHFNIRHHTFWDLFFSGSRWISYWLNAIHYSIGKFNPLSYRLGNISIHTMNGLLLFGIYMLGLAKLKKKSFFYNQRLAISMLTMVFFLLHPVQTQTVSYVIQGELEGLAALFSFATICMFLVKTNTSSPFIHVAVTISIYTLALFSCGTKEITIVLPFLLVLVDWFFIAQGSWQDIKKRRGTHLLLFFLITLMYVYLLKPHFFYQALGLQSIARNNIGNIITKDPLASITSGAFFISQFKVILHYLWIFIWPFNISVEYDWVLSESFFALDCLIPFLALASLCLIVFYFLRTWNYNIYCFGPLWFAICMLPRSTIIPSPELLADYKTYLGSAGIFFMLACFIVKVATYSISKIYRPMQLSYLVQIAGIMIASIPLGYGTNQRNKVWSSGTKFWGNIIKNAPGKARAYNNYGVELSQNFGKFADSIPYFQRAIAMDAHYPDPCNNLAVAYARTGDIESAIKAIKQGLKINPYHPEGYNNLASFYIDKKEYEKAKKSLKFALKLRPHYGKAFVNLGRLYSEQGLKEKAWECYKNGCTKGDLDNEAGFMIYANHSMHLKKYVDAIFAYTKILEINPTHHVALFNLGNAYYLGGQHEHAYKTYLQAHQLYPNDARISYNLGEMYYKDKKYDQAIIYLEKICHSSTALPQAFLRLAKCYLHTGDIEKGKQSIMLLEQYPLSDPIKLAAHKILATLDRGTEV